MVSLSKVESPAQRFAPYIEELHEFFRSRHVFFGSTENLDEFPAHLADPAFHEEMGSMVRSILYRESEAISRTELTELVAIAVGGTQREGAATEFHEGLGSLLAFVTEAVGSQRAASIAALASDDEVATHSPEIEVVTAAAPLHLHFADLPAAPLAQAPEAAPYSSGAKRLPTNDRLSRALIDNEDRRTAEPISVSAASSTAAVSFPASREPRSFSAFLRRAYWLPGVCVSLLALVTAFLLQAHRHPQPATIPRPAVLTRATGLPEPSAHGSTQADVGQGSHRPAAQQLGGIGSAVRSTSRPFVARSRRDEAAASRSGMATASAHHKGAPAAPASSKVSPRILGGREGVFLASSGTMAAHLLAAPAPAYPRLASLTHVEGEVIVQVVVARDGTVEATRVLQGPRLLRGAAQHAIRRWRYRPYILDGKPTDVATIVTVNFRLSR